MRWELLAFLELCALCGMAVAQPLLDVFGRSPDFFIFHRAGTADVLLLVAAVTLTPALVLWGIGAGTYQRAAAPLNSLRRRLRWRVALSCSRHRRAR